MVTLSSEERDERIKHHLLASKELHPALMSGESEYKVKLQLYQDKIFNLTFASHLLLVITYS